MPAVVRVGLLADFAPLHAWPEGGAPTGFDVDFLRSLEPSLNLRFEFRRYERFDDLLAALATGDVQVSTATAQTAQRAAIMRFTRPYVSVQQAFIGRSDITSVPSTPDLAGRRLALVKGFVSESIAAERFPTASTPSYGTLSEAMQALISGEADFLFEALPVARSLIESHGSSQFAVLRTYGFPEGHLRLAVRLQNAALRDRLDVAIRDIPVASLAALRTRWLTTQPVAGFAVQGELTNTPPLRIGYFPGDRPYSLRARDGKAEGIGINLARAVLDRAGLAVGSFEPMELPQLLAALGEGRVDIALGLTDTAERRNRMTFVGPYRANPLVIISRQQYSIWELHQLSGRRLAMLKGFFGASYIRSMFPTIEIVECPNFNDCLDRVQAGEADAAMYGLQGAYERLTARTSRDLQITGVVAALFDEQNFGLSLQQAHLAPRLRLALDQALKDDLPRIETAWTEYTANQVSRDKATQVIGAAVLALVALALAWWLHTRRLKDEIAATRKARVEAEAARAESEGYLAFLAHEVRNSLQSVSGAVDLLRAPGAQEADRQVLLPALGRSARSTLGLLNGLLDRHRLQGPGVRLVLASARLETVVRDIVDEMRAAAEAKGLQLVEQLPTSGPPILIDTLRVQQIVRNLVINAVKFSDRGVITVTASIQPMPGEPRAGQPGRQQIEVAVQDHGRGIAKADQERIFGRFVTTEGDRPGAGLGLGLCRDLAHAMDGSLAVQSQPGVGSIFSLRFAAPTAPVETTGAAQPLHRAVRQVLVLEDSPVYSLLLEQAFDRAGIVARTCSTIAEAREALQAHPTPDLLLVDVNLPDGHVSALLSQPTWPPETPVVAMSADFDERETRRLQGLGVVACVPKDADLPSFIRQVLSRAAESRSSRSERSSIAA